MNLLVLLLTQLSLNSAFFQFDFSHLMAYTYFFYKNNFIRIRGSFLLKIYEQIKNNPASAEEHNLKF